MKSFKQFMAEGRALPGIERGRKEMAKAGLARIGMTDFEPSSKGVKPGRDTSRLHAAKVGNSFFLFRIFGEKAFGDEEEEARIPGVYKSKRAANDKAREIAKKTKESIR